MNYSPASVKARMICRRIIKILAVCLAFAAVIGVFLFANCFYLEVTPISGAELRMERDEKFIDPGVQVMLKGKFLLRQGIPLNTPVTAHGSVDSSQPGEYVLTYTADFLYLRGECLRFVTVVDPDPPSITLFSVPGQYTEPGEEYVEEGYSAWDSLDGDLTSCVIREEKDGFVYYSVTDSGGNQTTVSRRINYRDTLAPELILSGGSEITLDAGTAFEEPGFYAKDNLDGDLTAEVSVEGYVDIYIAGSYVLTYSVSDSAANFTAVSRTVNVIPQERPVSVIPEGKTIYLTFDDGPGEHTEELLDVLQAYDISATFFVVNTERLDLLPRMVAEGHAIGIHSVTHDYDEIYASPEAYFADLFTMQEIIYEACGVRTWLMRFPGGSSNSVSDFNPGIMTYLTQAVEDAGFTYFDWNVDSDDAGRAKTTKRVVKNLKAALKNKNTAIVLQHDTKRYSVDAVEEIILWGLENGYTFRALDGGSPTCHHSVNN